MLTAALALTASPALAGEAKRSTFGKLADGRAVPAVTLTNDNGLSATIIAYGATLQSVKLPDAAGKTVDVALGHDNIEDYIKNPQYYGSTVGRFANRIAKGKFTLDGKAYQTPVNNGENSLHGGDKGFDKVLWEVVEAKSGADSAHVTLRHVSRNGEMGYPGTLTVFATYTLDDKNALKIEYKATTDAPTIVNITNHAYWNLSGEGSSNGAMGHVLTIPADTYLPTDAGAIPTGEFRKVEGTVFDFRQPHAVGDRVRDATDEQIVFGRGYDHNWVIGREVTRDQHLMARVSDPASGRGFELWSNQPGLQFYSGNFFDGTSIGKAKRIYRMGDAIVLEPQIFPDTPNQPEFGSARLVPGQTYYNVMTYRFTAAPPAR
ncbi:galactose mutarotase [Sphingomonas gilva]|uniref:Aldose 1-epimerase n=2 Tax=Sphingomonas gilva TaxID=2305907 RepID=A0A396RY37_9SPHN|nr:galactose mutarotase [Sphingomonas gilva]